MEIPATDIQLDGLTLTSVHDIPNASASAAFTVSSLGVFREDRDIVPVRIDDRLQYMPWGHDNRMPYKVMDLIDRDETLSTCQAVNAEIAYGAGVKYDTCLALPGVRDQIAGFMLDNDMASYFLGACQDFKVFGFAVSVILLSGDGKRIVRLSRKEACHCRFAPANGYGRIPYILYADWTKAVRPEQIEQIELLDPSAPWADLRRRTQNQRFPRKFAILSRIPSPLHSYYPVPHYASLFKSKWYEIKQLIAIAKEAKLRNAAPLKYHISVSPRYWENLIRAENITDRAKQQERIQQAKAEMIDFLTGAENSGKVIFSANYQTPDGKVYEDVHITRIDSGKEGGDWETDIQEAINMVCFTLRVHSNLVGSVPGKGQTNNSGSDKRELYTISQAVQKPYHDILLLVHRIIIRYNGWAEVEPVVPFIQLTTLDEHQDAKEVKI